MTSPQAQASDHVENACLFQFNDSVDLKAIPLIMKASSYVTLYTSLLTRALRSGLQGDALVQLDGFAGADGGEAELAYTKPVLSHFVHYRRLQVFLLRL